MTAIYRSPGTTGSHRNITFVVALAATLMTGLVGAGSTAFGDEPNKQPDDDQIPLTVPKAVCGPNDHPETALQGQVPAALRASGFKGFNCNLELIGQIKGDGANWQSAEFREGRSSAAIKKDQGDADDEGSGSANRHGSARVCAYHGTAFTTAGRTNLGAPVIDLSEASAPSVTGFLTSISMLDPWESLKTNQRRKLLAADNGHNGGGGPEVDIYDLSTDCRFPQLLASIPVGTGTDGGNVVAAVVGHEGNWAPDGLTYYIGNRATQNGYAAVDMTDPTAPKLIAAWVTGFQGRPVVHGMSISDEGTRGYFVTMGGLNATAIADMTDPSKPATNGLLIYDLSEIQARAPNPKPRLISQLLWKDGSAAQHTINVKIRGEPYVIFVDEAGSGGVQSDAQRQAACAAGMTPYPMARIIDISDETKPAIVSRLMLEVHNPANCRLVLPDVVGLKTFTYGSHYCSVDNRRNATTLACGYFNAGIRVFDIRDPVRPREIAYFNPPGTLTPSPGSNHVTFAQWRAGGPDWCNAQVHLDADRGTLWTTCQDNGFLSLKFTNGVWPFPETRTPPGEQN
jgi:hypothetical protein